MARPMPPMFLRNLCRISYTHPPPRGGNGNRSPEAPSATGSLDAVDAPAPRLVTATGLTRSYRRGSRVVEALRGIRLTVDRGELLVVIGPSGGGKSTLLNVIGGLDRPDAGS